MNEEKIPVETRRTIEFGKNAKNIQAYANLHCNGNFTKAINEIAKNYLFLSKASI